MSDFAKEVRELMTQAEDADRDNREEAILDLKFEAGDQWNDAVRRQRETQDLPCITINTAQQYTAQVVGDWRANQTSIKVLPREDGKVDIAEIRSELIRSIELQSKADRVYASSLGQMVACGVSNFRIDVDYASEDAFSQDIFIRDIPDPLAVWWDPLAFDPTGRDATYCFVGDKLTIVEYRRRYPKAALPNLINRDAGSGWSDGKTVHVPEYWKIDERLRTIGMTADGKTVDLTSLPKGKWPKLAIDSDTKQPIIRENVKCKYAVMQLTNGMEPLADPYEARLPRLPIIRVMGRETMNDGRRVRFGVIRFMRDSIMMRNHNRSIRAELLMKAPRVNFFGPADAIEGREGDWSDYLAFNGSVMPTEVTARNLGALINEEELYSKDMMEVTGVHEASRGMPGNETSGRAILARQQEGDVATIVYHDNMVAAQQEAGEVINAYIPMVFDTARTIRAVGADLGVKMLKINDQNDPESVDIGLGKYDVTISTGPAFQTRRQQAVDAMMQLINANPPLANVIGDLVIQSLDIPEADKIAERVKRTIPPQILGDDAEDGKSPEEIQAQQQKAAQAQQVQDAGIQLEMGEKQADVRLKNAQADEAEAKAGKAKLEMMQAMAGMGGQAPDPSVAAEEQRTAIMGYDAITKRLGVLSNQKNAPSALETHLSPIIANAVGQALAHHLGFAPIELGLPSAEPALGPPDTAAQPGAPA